MNLWGGVVVLLLKIADNCSPNIKNDPNYLSIIKNLQEILIALCSLEVFGVIINRSYVKVILFVWQELAKSIEIEVENVEKSNFYEKKEKSSFLTFKILLKELKNELSKPFFTLSTFLNDKIGDISFNDKLENVNLADIDKESNWTNQWETHLKRKNKFERILKREEVREMPLQQTGMIRGTHFIENDQISGYKKSQKVPKNLKGYQKIEVDSQNQFFFNQTEDHKKRKAVIDKTGNQHLQKILKNFDFRTEFVDSVRNGFLKKLGDEAQVFFSRIREKIAEAWLFDVENIYIAAVKFRVMILTSEVSFYDILELLIYELPLEVKTFEFRIDIKIKKVLKKLVKSSIEEQKLGNKKMLSNFIKSEVENTETENLYKIRNKPQFIESYFEKAKIVFYEERQSLKIQQKNIDFLINYFFKKSLVQNCAFIIRDFIKRMCLYYNQMYGKLELAKFLSKTLKNVPQNFIGEFFCNIGKKLFFEFLKGDFEESVETTSNIVEFLTDFIKSMLQRKEFIKTISQKDIFFSINKLKNAFLILQQNYLKKVQNDYEFVKNEQNTHGENFQQTNILNEHSEEMLISKRNILIRDFNFNSIFNKNSSKNSKFKLFKQLNSFSKVLNLFVYIQSLIDDDTIIENHKKGFKTEKFLLETLFGFYLFIRKSFFGSIREIIEEDIILNIKSLLMKNYAILIINKDDLFSEAISSMQNDICAWSNFSYTKLSNRDVQTVKTTYNSNLKLFEINTNSENKIPLSQKFPQKTFYTKNRSTKIEIINLVLSLNLTENIRKMTKNWNEKNSFMLYFIDQHIHLYHKSTFQKMNIFKNRNETAFLMQSLFKKIISQKDFNLINLSNLDVNKQDLSDKLNLEISNIFENLKDENLQQFKNNSKSEIQNVRKSILMSEFLVLLDNCEFDRRRKIFDQKVQMNEIKHSFLKLLEGQNYWILNIFEQLSMRIILDDSVCHFFFEGLFVFIKNLLSSESMFALKSLICQAVLCHFYDVIEEHKDISLLDNQCITFKNVNRYEFLFFKMPLGLVPKNIDDRLSSLVEVNHETGRLEFAGFDHLERIYNQYYLKTINEEKMLKYFILAKNIGVPFLFSIANGFIISFDLNQKIPVFVLLVIVLLLLLLIFGFTVFKLIQKNCRKIVLIGYCLYRNLILLLCCSLLLFIDLITKKTFGMAICMLLSQLVFLEFFEIKKCLQKFCFIGMVVLFFILTMVYSIYWLISDTMFVY